MQSTSRIRSLATPYAIRLASVLLLSYVSICYSDSLRLLAQKMVRELFDETDLDGSGALDKYEIGHLAANMGVKLDQAELSAAMQDMDESAVSG